MKSASLTAALLKKKGTAAPSLSNRQTQDYEETKSQLFASLATGSGVDEEVELVVPVVDEEQHVTEIPEVLPPAQTITGPRISTSLRLGEERHLQLRVLAAKKRTTIQNLLATIVHEYLDTEAENIAKPSIGKIRSK